MLWLFILIYLIEKHGFSSDTIANTGIYTQYDQYMKALESLSVIKIYVISYMMYHLQKHTEQSIHTLPYMVNMVCDVSCIQRLIYDIVSCLYTFPHPKINASLSPPPSPILFKVKKNIFDTLFENPLLSEAHPTKIHVKSD